MRLANPSDRPALTRLWTACFGDEPAVVEDFWARMWPEITIFTLENCAAMATAMPVCWQEKPTAYLYAVATDPSRRGEGLCSRLMAEVCRRLFVLLRRVLTAAVVAGAAMLAAGVWLCRDRRWVRRAAWIAPLALAIPLGAFAGWAAVDFDSAFNFFHEMLFTNDLWLLDPRTDLLIRICPQSMFMNMGLRIGLMSLAWVLAVPALATLITAMKKERV